MDRAFLLVPLVALLIAAFADRRERLPHTRQVEQDTWIVDDIAEWQEHTAQRVQVSVEQSSDAGGAFDLMGNGALMLEKANLDHPFWAKDRFKDQGRWASRWHEAPAGAQLERVQTTLLTYGQEVDMGDWKKFSGGPLVAEQGWVHATPQTLELSPSPEGWPQDQALVRGTGRWAGQWLLIFNIGSGAAGGWGMAVADSLAPLKEGTNPFVVEENPYPLHEGRGPGHGPNDWIVADGTYYGIDDQREEVDRIWTSTDLTHWTSRPIKNLVGHDSGIVYDGDRFLLFVERSSFISYCELVGERCATNENVLEVGGHTGDADVVFFNNRWHMFIDTNPHEDYRLGYASTAPSAFPRGWQLHSRHIIGPYNPDQGQVWDDPTPEGNAFGTGDADVALEGTTLYLTWERPVGIAFNELEEVYDGEEQAVRMKVEVDTDADGRPDASTAWHRLPTGTHDWDEAAGLEPLQGGRFRILFRLETDNPNESPMLANYSLHVKTP